ncbi:uncharacterized protein LOC123507609 [Portunus trituberculatus]|uniref:uncharacterized protein LOC123507609 n=1 Tax=Portunus trituberculatus TaxID=210409 RepID=UPI001E1CBE12|nr:uncharacterized protein LOC123507609 [Portunus trituberculatus]
MRLKTKVEPENYLLDDERHGIHLDVKSNAKQGWPSPNLSQTTRNSDTHLPEPRHDLLEGLRCVTVLLGLLPGRGAEVRVSCWARARFCCTLVAVVIVATPFIIVEGYLWPKDAVRTKGEAIVSTVMMISFAFCLTLTGWFITASFWARQGSIVALFQQCSQLHPTSPSVWPHIARVMFLVAPHLINYLLYSTWYNVFRIGPNTPHGTFLVFLVSYVWLHVLQVMPLAYFLFFGQLILDSLAANNQDLTRALQEAAGEAPLLQIHQRTLTLRRLYGELERVLSLPLLWCKIFITFILTDNMYFMMTFQEKHGMNFYQYCCSVSSVLTLVGVGLACRMADNIREQGEAPVEILTTLGGTRGEDHTPSLTWPSVPHQVTIYRLAERPLVLKVGTLYPLSLTNLLSSPPS